MGPAGVWNVGLEKERGPEKERGRGFKMMWMNYLPLLIWMIGGLWVIEHHEVKLKKYRAYSQAWGAGAMFVYLAGTILFLVIGLGL